MKKEVHYPLDTFGGRLQDLRIKKGLSRNAFYKALKGKNGEIIPEGYGEKTVRSWESGNAWPSAELLGPICRLLGCCSDYLLCNIQEKDHDKHYICSMTGLSEKAVNSLISRKDHFPSAAARCTEALDFLITNPHLVQLARNMTEALRSSAEAKKDIDLEGSGITPEIILSAEKVIRLIGDIPVPMADASNMFAQQSAFILQQMLNEAMQKGEEE